MIVQGNALFLPLRDEAADLVIHDLPFNYQGGGGPLVEQADLAGYKGHEKKRIVYFNFISAATAEAWRVLKPGGNLVVVNNPQNFFETAVVYHRFNFRNGVPLIRPGSFSPAWHLAFAHNYIWFLCKGDLQACWYGNKKIIHGKRWPMCGMTSPIRTDIGKADISIPRR